MVELPEEYSLFSYNNLGFALVALGALVFVGSMATGIDDNPFGTALLFGSITCWILAIVRNWSSPRSFMLLALGALIGFLVFAVLHNVLYGLGELASNKPFLHGLCEVCHVVSFVLAVLIAPPVLVVALLGWSVSGWRQKHQRDLKPQSNPSD